MKKRILSLLLAILMLVGTLPVSVFAQDQVDVTTPSEDISEGELGDEVCATCGNEPCTCEEGEEEGEEGEEGDKPLCSCTPVEGVHAATCPAYTCPNCGAAQWHETCPETGDAPSVCEVCGNEPCTCEEGEEEGEEGEEGDKPLCSCTPVEGVHAATCPAYTCPDCGAAQWHETCPETGDETPACEICGNDPCTCEDAACEVCGNEPCTCETGEEPDYSANLRKYVILNKNVTYYTVGSTPGSGFSYYYEDFTSDAIFRIKNWEVVDGTVWYLVEFYKGAIVESTFTADFPSAPWICATTDGADAIVFLTACGVCDKPDCETDHTQPENPCGCCDECTGDEECACECEACEFCKVENPCGCCDECTGDEECSCQCEECEFCKAEVPSISATVNGQTVTVSGAALPEGAELEINETSISSEITDLLFESRGKSLAYDISIGALQPNGDVKVTLSGLPFADGEIINVVHYLDDVDAIVTGLQNGTVIPLDISHTSGAADTFVKELAACRQADSMLGIYNSSSQVYLYISVKRSAVSGGSVSFYSDSFSIYYLSNGTWRVPSSSESSGLASNKRILMFPDNTTGSARPKGSFVVYATPGQTVYFNEGMGGISDKWKLSGDTGYFTGWSTGSYDAQITVKAANQLGFYKEVIVSDVYTSWFTDYTSYVTVRIVPECTITYALASGAPSGAALTTTSTTTVLGNGTTNYPYATITLPTPTTPSGYSFAGWYDASGNRVGGAGNSYEIRGNGSSTSPAATVATTLYARWTYAVTYALNSGTGTSTTQTINTNNTVTLHGAPTRSGYNFLGWYSSADGVVYSAGATYSAKKPTTMTALWGKTDSNGSWNSNFYVLPGTSAFSEHLKVIDGATKANTSTTVARPNIVADSNTYYVAPNTTLTFERSGGQWRIDAAETGITTSVGTSWTSSGSVTVNIGGSAAAGTTMMLYSRNPDSTTVNCARIIVKAREDVTTMSINDTQNIYRVGVYILRDSTKIPGEPNYTTGIQMINVNGGMNYSPTAKGVVLESIANAGHYDYSLDGSCTMGAVSYTGHETVPFVSETALGDAMDRVISELKNNGEMIAVDGANLTELYKEKGEAYIRTNYVVRPHVVKLMTGLSYIELGWHIDCSIYPQQTVTLTYNLNPPAGYVLKNQGTPAPGVYTGDLEVNPATFTVSGDLKVGGTVNASVSGATDTATLTFEGWNTEPDGSGDSYAPGDPVTITEDIILYAQWTGGLFTTGTLEIEKKLTVAEGSELPNANDSFEFSINLSGSYPYHVYNSLTSAQESSGTMTNGKFTIKAGQYIRFAGVPVGDYTITETLPENYSNGNKTQTVSLKGGYVNHTTFTNRYKKLITYTATFAPNGGSVSVTSRTFNIESALALPVPARAGYAFTGWKVTSAAGNWNSNDVYTGTSVAAGKYGNVTLTAQWSKMGYSIGYDLKDGELPAGKSNPTSYAVDSAAITLNNPEKTGYEFTGWTESIDPVNWISGFVDINTGAYQAYNSSYPNAHYSEKIYLEAGVTYTLTGYSGGIRWRYFDLNGSFLGNLSLTATFTPGQNGYVNILLYESTTAADRDSVRITSSQGTSVTIASGSTGNRYYTANYEIAKYAVSYEYTGTIPTAATAVPVKKDYTFDTSVSVEPAPAAVPGYTFHGWKTSDATVSNGSFTMPEKAVKFTGNWTANTDTPYKVETYIQNLADSGYTMSSENKNGTTGSTVNANTTAPEGFTYNAEKSTVSGTVKADGSLVLKVYFDRNQYKVSYEYEGTAPNGAPAAPVETTEKYGADVSVAAVPEAIPGYTFSGWKTSDVTVSNGSFQMPAKAVKFTGKWTPIDYTISYNLDGGALDEDESNPEAYTVESQGFTLHNPTKEGYIFAGWTGSELDEATLTVNILKGSTGDRVYTATWIAVDYSIAYNLDGGVLAEGESNPESYTIEDSFTLYNPTRVGHTFEGWVGTELDEATETVSVFEGSTGNRSYTATWKAIVYDVKWYGYNNIYLTTTHVAYGDMPVQPTGVDLNDRISAEFTEKFIGWDPELVPVTGDTSYMAKYDKTRNWYYISFEDDDGTVLKEPVLYMYGTPAAEIVKPEDPVKPATAQYTYTFAGWDPTVDDVKGTVTYKATYSATVNQYTLSGEFDIPERGASVPQTTTVEYGNSATILFETKPGYYFNRYQINDGEMVNIDVGTWWKMSYAQMTRNIHYKMFTEIFNYTIEYDLAEGIWPDGAVHPESYTVEDTLTITNPAKAGYKFVGWKVTELDNKADNWVNSYANISGFSGMYGNIKLTAQWERSLVDLTIVTNSTDANQSFVFTVSGIRSDGVEFKSIEVVLVGNDSITIKDVPVGVYIVTEKNNWSWRQNNGGSQTADLREESKTVTFSFGVDRHYWLSGCSYYGRRKGGNG